MFIFQIGSDIIFSCSLPSLSFISLLDFSRRLDCVILFCLLESYINYYTYIVTLNQQQYIEAGGSLDRPHS
jgi:hypothetical protein